MLLNVVYDVYCNVLSHFLRKPWLLIHQEIKLFGFSKDYSCASNKPVHFKIHLCATLQKYAEHMK
jgi:hypothetical protein